MGEDPKQEGYHAININTYGSATRVNNNYYKLSNLTCVPDVLKVSHTLGQTGGR